VATQVALVGRFTPDRRAEMAAAVARGGGEAHAFPEPSDALPGIRKLSPNVVFLDAAEGPRGAGLLAALRGDVAVHSIPVVWVAGSAADGAFVAGHAAGADDAIVLGDDAAVVRRVAVLGEMDPAFRPEATQGKVVVAHADLGRRRILGRTLRAAGFDPAFVADQAELARAVDDPGVVLVVASQDLPGDGGASPAPGAGGSDGFLHGLSVPVVILAPAASWNHVAAAARDAGIAFRVAAQDSPAADLLFLANDLLRPDVRNLRSSPRILHATVCAYRPAGELHGTWGLTYNVSREGLYVRTLDAPPRDAAIWLELRPPGDRSAVHLRGSVVWARAPQRGAASAPPGFAVRLEPNACPPADLVAYDRAYSALPGA